MKHYVKRTWMLAAMLILICALSVSAFAATISVNKTYDSVYSVEAYGTNTGIRAFGTVSVYKSDTDEYLSDVYRYVRVDYQYYPLDDGPLTSDTVSYSTSSRPGCTAAISTTMDNSIYLIRYATFTFEADVPLSSGTRRFYEQTSPVEYIPE